MWLKEKQDENEKLNAAVAAGTVRLRLAATCTTGVDDGGTAELNATARPTYNALRAGIAK
ncbi:lysis system i-spanin subunit Rz [Pollutimonas bauzanensis]|uniref:lysis system i-spanin subunit Rz n=1 Tax=Pollutimonas bauzanensis TaxID=658167 RepID=UPI0009329AAC